MTKITIPDEHGDRYQLENWISKLNRRNDLKTAPINAPLAAAMEILSDEIRNGPLRL
jgi:hypothetical protein